MATVLRKKPAKKTLTRRIILDDGTRTTVHVVSYPRESKRPRLVLFSEETCLPAWCKENNISEALVGGFFLRAHGKPLGEMWIRGERQPSIPFASPWHAKRGSLHLAEDLTIDYRHHLPATPPGDLLQAGPLLIRNGTSLLSNNDDNEGFSAAAHQFDSDITEGRHPRAAIGSNATHIFSVVCDGRSPEDAGMTLAELAGYMANLGCTEALNLDGGGSASLVTNGRLLNTPRGDGQEYLNGRPIFTAIIIEERKR